MLSSSTSSLTYSRSPWIRPRLKQAKEKTLISLIQILTQAVTRLVSQCSLHRACEKFSKFPTRIASWTNSVKSINLNPVKQEQGEQTMEHQALGQATGTPVMAAQAPLCNIKPHRRRPTSTKWFNISTDTTVNCFRMARRRTFAWVLSKVKVSRVLSSTTLSFETCLICISWGIWVGLTQAKDVGESPLHLMSLSRIHAADRHQNSKQEIYNAW